MSMRRSDVNVDFKSPTIEGPDLDFNINSTEYKTGLKWFFKRIGGQIKIPEAWKYKNESYLEISCSRYFFYYYK